MHHRTILLFTFCLVLATTAAAQINISLGEADLHSGKVGLGLDGITGSNNILLKYFFNNQLAGELIGGFALDSPGGDAPTGMTKVTGLVLRGGAGIIVHLTRNQLSPYLGFQALFETASDAGFYTREPDRRNSLIVAAVVGGEYFAGSQFSVGLRQAVGMDLRLKRDYPEEDRHILLATSTVFTCRFYFN